jgi:hypothetical protein
MHGHDTNVLRRFGFPDEPLMPARIVTPKGEFHHDQRPWPKHQE